MRLFLGAYLAIGVVIGLACLVYLLERYGREVFRPAAEAHGRAQVAAFEDGALLVALSALALVAWLPLALGWACIRARRLVSRERSRENDPTPTL